MSGQALKKILYQPIGYQKEIHYNPSRFRVLNIGRRGGKTELVIEEMVMRSLLDPGLYWIVAPSYRQVKSICWTRLKAILAFDIEHWKLNESELSAENITTKSKIELKGADNEESLKGVGLKGVALDEAALIKMNVWPEIIRPMLAESQGWALFTSTPKGKNWFYDVFMKGMQGEKDWKSWSLPTNANPYVVTEEIEVMRKELPDRTFRQEILAEFIDEDTGVFKKVRQCCVGELKSPEMGRFYVIGADIAKTEDFTVFTVIDSVERHVVAMERIKDVQWTEQKFRLQELANRYNNALVLIDSTGVGDPILEDLSHSNISVEGYKFTNESKKKLVENLQLAIEQRLITIPPLLDIMIEELKAFEYKVTQHGNITYGAPDGKHDDCCVSLGLACWGIRFQLRSAQADVQRAAGEDFGDRQGRGDKVAVGEDFKILHEQDEIEETAGY